MRDVKTVSDLRSVLAEEITRLKTHKSTPKETNAVVHTVGTILSSVRLEMEYLKLMGLRLEIGFMGKKGSALKAPTKARRND